VSWRALREARRYVLYALVGDLMLLLSGRRAGWMGAGAALASVAFFRDPERVLDPEPDTVYATADGVIVGVERASDPWLAEQALRISTFLALYDVHVIRSPVAGGITLSEEIQGGFAPAFLGRAGANLRKRLAIEGPAGRVVVVQIAGMLARRITSWTGLGSRLATGQRVGLIHFGSRTDVLLPADRFEARVRVGERVKAGVTPIACGLSGERDG
jgi:phosphatidylserine decarboxylase